MFQHASIATLALFFLFAGADVLVKNGALNADYTPNEATAARMGWKLKNPDEVPVADRWWLSDQERQRLLKIQTQPERTTPVVQNGETRHLTRVREVRDR